MIVSRRFALALGGVAAAAVVGTAGVAAAAGSSGGRSPQVELAAVSSPAPTVSGSPSVKAGERRAKHAWAVRLGRGLHGEFVAKGKDGKFVTVVTVRGTVTAVSPTAVTFKAEDGYTTTFTVGSGTKVRGKDVDAIADVKVGDSGGAAGAKGADGIAARTVVIRRK